MLPSKTYPFGIISGTMYIVYIQILLGNLPIIHINIISTWMNNLSVMIWTRIQSMFIIKQPLVQI